jgi:hypothetical protein
MYLGQIDVANIVGAIVGSNLAARPIEAFDPEFRPRFISFDERDVGMPTVVGFYFRRFGGLLQIGVKTTLGMALSSPRLCY